MVKKEIEIKKRITTIQINPSTLKLLKLEKIYRRETYDEVILRLLEERK